MSRCKGTTKTGTRCQRRQPEEYCFQHRGAENKTDKKKATNSTSYFISGKDVSKLRKDKQLSKYVAEVPDSVKESNPPQISVEVKPAKMKTFKAFLKESYPKVVLDPFE